MRRDDLRLADALDAMTRIERYVARGREAFDRDELIQVWFLYHLAIIGEALRAMSPGFQQTHAQLDWPGWTGLRNVVVHQYFRIHPERIWNIVTRELPSLKAQLISIPGPSDRGD